MTQSPTTLFQMYKDNSQEYDKVRNENMFPPLDDPNFVEKLLSKKEFGRYVSKTSRVQDYDGISRQMCSPTEFRTTPNQNFVSNFLSPYTPYNGLLLFHSVGVGKTASAISIAEKYYDYYKRRVFVILSGNIKENFKKQIFDITKYSLIEDSSQIVTGTKYPDMVFDKETISKEVLEKKINKFINERYQFIGYKELVEIIKRLREKVNKADSDPQKQEKRLDEKLKEMFSNRLIIVDEAHNLRMQSEGGNKQVSKAMMDILKLTFNTKLLLMTATPMYDDAKEVIWILNLLLANDKKTLLRPSQIFDKVSNELQRKGKDKLYEIATKYVSFMRGENPFTFPFRLYPSINKDPRVIAVKLLPSKDSEGNQVQKIQHLELIGSIMSDHQRNVYEEKLTRLDDDDDSSAESPEDIDTLPKDIQKAIQISNVAYPDGYGRNGFNSTIIKSNEKQYKYKNKTDQIFRYENIGQYAPKIKTVLDCIQKSKGIVFIYSQYYESGILPLVVALEHLGFGRYNSQNLMQGITVDKDASKVKKNYVVISRNKMLSPNNETDIMAAKSVENADGSVVKVIIASRIAIEGIDFKRIREVHVLEPWFNLNRVEQIIGRAVRTCSHIDLPKEERNVTIYLHANQYDAKNSKESIDLRMYRMSETKQLRIAQIERILKEGAVDCPLNRAVLNLSETDLGIAFAIVTSIGKQIPNYKLGDKDGSFMCGFGKCKLDCKFSIDQQTLGTNNNTFDPIFIANEVDLYKRFIVSLFKGSQKAHTYDSIYDQLSSLYSDIDKDVLAYTLDEMVELKHSFNDKYSNLGHLIFRGNKYIFQGPTDNRASLSERLNPEKRPGKVDLGMLVSYNERKGVKQAVPGDQNKERDDDQNILINTIRQRFDDLVQNVANLEDKTVDTKFILDCVIDNLNEFETKQLFKVLFSHHQDDVASPIQSIITSLKQTGMFVTDSKGVLTHFYNHFDDKVYTTKSIEPIGQLDILKLGDAYQALKSRVILTIPKDIGGYIDTKKGQHVFKVKPSTTTSGYVCATYSEKKIEDLKKEVGFIGKGTKKVLCNLLEIQLRHKGKVLRPWMISPNATHSKESKN